uniref:mitogen-activated protein kinase n=1 Tax=Chromera velia CCMP2878 TaxID=1169474 RepID=A0A0G4G7T4_9ALVE|eukprot:Cvel_20608.t1-p1 / transcript=Cvel_20608.t1 / gene=Cvel_20608 / organism=Chromera_velia_CCMP2878 / gene_product=Mitogen-activated protein kinase homolog D5, putative / transcript_product=Mitogen-activated protein kinase homolog D5, putative / location=Cvel_scaffold1864:30570-36623(+) / protein_length=535 / sequence_SO=supercontig / SO=protein_coding / is_pseudo=false
MKKVQVDPKRPDIVFRVPETYQFKKKLGAGAYGCVCSFEDSETKKTVAVKKITDAYREVIDAKRILREIKILQHLKHDNLVEIFDILPPESPTDEDIYIVMPLMYADLHKVIQSKQELSEKHMQYFIYQILRGLHYLHGANILHRDLKPGNVLVDENCDLRICDLGLARGCEAKDGSADKDQERLKTMTEYVATRWYRAPEVILDAAHYTYQMDVWAVGCIIVEMLGRQPLFTGEHYIDQIKKIVKIVGHPTKLGEDTSWMSPEAKQFMASVPLYPGQDLQQMFPNANPLAVDLAKQMLVIDWRKRISVENAMKHPYLKPYFDARDLKTPVQKIDWAFDDFEPTKKGVQERIFAEAAKFHPEILERDAGKLKGSLATSGTEKASRRASQQIWVILKKKEEEYEAEGGNFEVVRENLESRVVRLYERLSFDWQGWRYTALLLKCLEGGALVNCIFWDFGENEKKWRNERRRLMKYGGVMPLDMVADVLRDMVYGCGAVHECEHKHEDIKPENVVFIQKDRGVSRREQDRGARVKGQ